MIAAEKFWTGWLKISMLLVIAGGILLILLYNLGWSEFIDRKIDRVFSLEELYGRSANHLRSWLVSITGSIMAAWGLSMLYLLHNAFQKREKWAWRSIFYPLLTWYLIDSGISAFYGVEFNVILNTVLFLQIVAPLLFLKNQFFVRTKFSTL